MTIQYAVVFPGQGSQKVGMLDSWNKDSKIVNTTLDEASEALGYNMRELIALDENELLGQTAYTQPALLTAGLIAWREWIALSEQEGFAKPVFLAGHSLGEYTALVASGVLEFSAALELVQFRGQCMQEAVPAGQGAMAAILGLDDGKVIEACELASSEGVVAAVNFNAPGQVVIAGETSAVDVAITMAKDSGAKRALSLPVSVPSHCVLMKPASERLADRLAQVKIHDANIPVIHNADVQSHTEDSDIRSALVKQLYSPVRWVESMQYLAEQGVTHIVECGPGKVLSGLQRRIDRSVKALPLFGLDTLDTIKDEFKSLLDQDSCEAE